ncbi:Dipeptidyl-peptidase 5 [Daldinia childiae]|uniref:Dipeptidyl-peptidase 5 n=1 Tax=Daldinia childiae TaxID=326645 RepID=UPI001447E5AA|nr:Dipeptidyl-peptidase 5 [Daldinia childiae]KAF3065016.1 Dipeptidyl-peptidase 5 [Daldinia childiae]
MDPQPTSKLFTPEILSEDPILGGARPNHDGTQVLYSERKANCGGRIMTKCWKIMDVATGEWQTLITDQEVFEAIWLADEPDTIITLSFDEYAPYQTQVATYDLKGLQVKRQVACLLSKVSDLRVERLKNGSIAFAVIGKVGINGELRWERNYTRPDHHGLVYDTDEVRTDDEYMDNIKESIFFSILTKSEEGWALAGPLHNALANTDLKPHKSYNISQDGIVFIAEDYSVKHVPSRIRHAYLLRLDSFSSASTHGPRKIEIPDESPDESDDHSSSPHFSPDGSQVMFLRGDNIHIYQIGESKSVKVLDTLADGKWPLIATEIQFAPSGKAIYVSAEDHGRTNLYEIDLQSKTKPRMLFRGGTVTAFYPLGKSDGQILVTSSSLVDGSLYSIIYTDETQDPRLLLSLTNHGARLGISSSQISEIHFKGAGDYQVHAWMVKPSYFDESRKYPLVLLVHGGPKGSWGDEWSATINLALFAEQGYIVVAPNITGSTGFGREFERAIQDNWGGRPYDDLVKCMDYLEQNPNIDIDKAVMIGFSYGGYMCNWAQGHPLGRRFKAMVSWGGVFHLPTYFMERDICPSLKKTYRFSGSEILWKNPEGLERFNPARPDLLPSWKTPMLVVHGSDDFRSPVTGAIAAFRTLQLLGTPSRLLIFLDTGHYKYQFKDIRKYHQEDRTELITPWQTFRERVKSWCRKVFSRPKAREEEKSASPISSPEACEPGIFNDDGPPKLDVLRGPTLSDSLSDTGFILYSEPAKKKKSKQASADKFRYSFRSEGSRPVSMIIEEGSK